MRIDDALQKYLVQLLADGRSPHTIHQYQRHVHLLGTWIDATGTRTDIAAIDHELIAAFLVSDQVRFTVDGRIRKATSANAIRSSLRNFFGYLHKSGSVAIDPTRLVRRARCSPPPPRALSDDEKKRLLHVLDKMESVGTDADRRDQALIVVLLQAGIRIGSALSLLVTDIDLEAGNLHLRSSKGGRPDIVVLPPGAAKVLREYVGDRVDGPVFLGHEGKPISTRHFHRRLALWMRRAGIDRQASPHTLRHTFGTDLLRQTGNLRLVQVAMRHRSIASTTAYAMVGDDQVRAAVCAVAAG